MSKDSEGDLLVGMLAYPTGGKLRCLNSTYGEGDRSKILGSEEILQLLGITDIWICVAGKFMSPLIEQIVVTLQQLPESKIQEILDFARFLSWQTLKDEELSTEEPLLVVAGMLSGESIANEDIDEELYDDKDV